MMNKKGQGLTEYGIILLLILGIGMGIWNGSDLNGNIKNMFSTISSKLNAILYGFEQNFDGSETLTQKNRKTGATETSLTFTVGGKEYKIIFRAETNHGDKSKLYAFNTVADNSNYKGNSCYTGTNGLMIWSYNDATKGNKGEDYRAAGYTLGSDETGDYYATYFNSGGQTYIVKDYYGTAGSTSSLTNFVGDTNTTVTNAFDNSSTTIAKLADARTTLITKELSGSQTAYDS